MTSPQWSLDDLTPSAELIARRQNAAERFNQRDDRSDGARVMNALADGFSVLRDLFFTRIHEDVEAEFGMDSMLAPVQAAKSERVTKVEIEIFQCAEAANEAVERGFVGGGGGDWLAQILLELRLGAGADLPTVQKRLARHLIRDRDERELFFSNALVADFPEASRAPLVLLRLFPLAVDLVTATSFENPMAIQEIRDRQEELLPYIVDCRRCHGTPLGVKEVCPACGNPVWNYQWLLTSD